MKPTLALTAALLLAAACSSVPPRNAPSHGSATQPAPSGGGKYYLDDGPGANAPELDRIPDAVPRPEPLARAANRPYQVFGREYVPATMLKPYRERGIASWYGRRFHGQKTSIGEPYDMYAMTAAHPTLPLPSYARVTNVATGKSVVVRVNDRGPFLHDRIIDLSYAAAQRIGIAQAGSGEVEVEAILPAAYPQYAQTAQPLPAAVANGPTATAPALATASDAASDTSNAAVVTTPIAPVSTLVPAANAPIAAAPAPAPVDAPAPTADIAPVAPMRGGYSVQLGAFSNYANAQAFLAHAQNQLAAARVEARIRQAGGLYRVYIGPYSTRSEAERLSSRITQAFGFPTTIAAH